MEQKLKVDMRLTEWERDRLLELIRLGHKAQPGAGPSERFDTDVLVEYVQISLEGRTYGTHL